MKNDNIEFETIRSNKNRILFFGGIVCVVVLLVAFVLTKTFAKYRTAQSMPLINGTVNYDLADLNVVAVYLQDESTSDGYAKSDTIPTSGYTFNDSMSYCTVDGVKDDSITLSYDIDTQTLNVAQLTTKGTKCYLYFDEYRPSAKETLLANYQTVLTRSDFSTTVTNSTTGTIYKSADSSQYDDDGEVYYFAGNPTDNWVSFAGFYWRIIRVNGDGSIRLIYSGSEASGPVTEGEGTQISTSAFNSLSDYSYYVGLSYDTTQHGTGTESTILTVLNNWYSGLSTTNKNYIDSNVGFCSDRNIQSGTWSASVGPFYYAAYGRLYATMRPSLLCSSNDVLNIPVGLITADEVAYAGGVYGTNNSNISYYLYTNQHYWTMTPALFKAAFSPADVFYVNSFGYLSMYSSVSNVYGVRPVINLKADTQFTASGTSSDPYRVV